MIFVCDSEECGAVIECEATPEGCPACGKPVTEAAEEALTPRQWTDLGVYWNGEEGEAAVDRAFACFRKAAMLGDVPGIHNLAVYTINGWGREEGEEEARWLFEQAAESGYIPSVYSLGRCYQYGQGTPADPEQAFTLYLQAAENGHPQAQMKAPSAGIRLRHGRGMPLVKPSWADAWSTDWAQKRMRLPPWDGIKRRRSKATMKGSAAMRPVWKWDLEQSGMP